MTDYLWAWLAELLLYWLKKLLEQLPFRMLPSKDLFFPTFFLLNIQLKKRLNEVPSAQLFLIPSNTYLYLVPHLYITCKFVKFNSTCFTIDLNFLPCYIILYLLQQWFSLDLWRASQQQQQQQQQLFIGFSFGKSLLQASLASYKLPILLVCVSQSAEEQEEEEEEKRSRCGLGKRGTNF